MSTTQNRTNEVFNLGRENLNKVMDKIGELIREGNVRNVIVKNPQGQTILVVPLTVGVVKVEGCEPPAVIARRDAPPGAPTLLLYAHHDVQPTGPLSLWKTDPFVPVEKDGRLYGRGTSDDKCGVVMHLGALRAFEGDPPVGIALFIEGEEESGSEHLARYLEEYKDELRCDVVVNTDSGTWRVGEPGITTSLRGIVSCIIEVRTLDHAVHSGEYGGAG